MVLPIIYSQPYMQHSDMRFLLPLSSDQQKRTVERIFGRRRMNASNWPIHEYFKGGKIAAAVSAVSLTTQAYNEGAFSHFMGLAQEDMYNFM